MSATGPVGLLFRISRARSRAVLRLDARLRRVELIANDWRKFMSKTTDALAELDAQIDELEQYVISDDETDSTEVSQRAARLKDLLAQVRPAVEQADETTTGETVEPATGETPA